MVKEHQAGLRGGGDAGDLFHFAGADQRGGIGAVAPLQKLGGNLRAGACHQLAEFGQRLLGIEFRRRSARLRLGSSKWLGKSFLRTRGCASALRRRTGCAGAGLKAHSHQDSALQPPGILAAGYPSSARVSLQSKPLRVRSLRLLEWLPKTRP